MSKLHLSTYGGRFRDLGYADQIVDTNPVTIATLINDQASAIDFGMAVACSAANDTCKAPTVDGGEIVGISVRHAICPAHANNVNYAQKDAVAVLRDGFIYVVAYENAARGYGVICVTAQNGKLGSTTGTTAGAGRVAVPGTTWETTTTAGQIGIVRIAG